MERRNTHQKQLIMEAVQGTGIHRTAEEILQIVRQKDPGIGPATVYRNLNLFMREGQIQKIEGPGWSYFDGNPEPHDHLYCIRCGKIVDYPGGYNRRMDRTAEKTAGGHVMWHTTLYEGICSECLQKEAEEAVTEKSVSGRHTEP